MRRPAVVTAIAFGVVVFLTISLLLARGLSGAGVERAKTLDVLEAQARGDAEAVLTRLPAHRLLPAALVAPDKQLVVTAVCSARPLAEGKPPMGIVCAQQDVARVYPLPDDPERCLEDFLDAAAAHARRAGEHLLRQEASVQRFLELSGEGFENTA